MRSTGMIKAQLSATVNKKYRSLLSLCLSLCLFLALTAIVGSPLWAANEGPNIPISIENGATAPDTATLLGEDQQNPTVIALPDKNKWFVVWEDWRNWGATGADIYGRFINGDGTYCGDEIPISTAAGNQTVPTAAYRNSPSGEDKILIAWQDTRGGAASGYLYYKVLDVSALAVDCASGVVLGGENIVGYSSIDSDSLISRKLPKVAYDAARDKFWLVWVESRNALQRIEEQPFGIAATLVGPYCEDGSNPNFTCEDGNDPDYLCADGSEPRLQCADGSYPVLKCEDLSDAWMDWISGQFIFNCADESVPIPVCGDNSIATPVCLDGSDVALRCRDSSDVAWRCEDGSECKYNRVAITTQWKFGDSNYASYVTVDAASGVAGIPEIIRNSDIIPLDTDEDGIFDNFRDSICTVRLISHSRSSEKDVYVYEYFKNVNNVTIACDDSSPETLIVWEGVRGRATLTCTYEDTNKNEVPDYFEPFFAELVLDEWENDDGLVHIFSIFDKYINQTVVNSQLIDASTKSCFYPAVGFDSSHRKFLVAWEDRDARDGAGDGIHSKIFGQLVYSGGGLYGANLPISFQDTNEDGIQDKNILDANQTRPQVAIDSTNQRFLVTWQDGRNSQVSLENLDIFGQFVDSEGSLRGNNYAVCVEPANQYNPVTVFNAGNHQFLSVWKDARNLNTTNSDIYGQRFTLGQPQLILLNDDDTSLVPPLLDFDSVQAGEAPTLLVKMKNIGDSVIKIDYVTPLEAPFTYVSLPPELLSVDDGNTLNLVPGASYKLYVKFEPTADGTFIDDFTIQSDATSLTINLQGVRVPTVPPVAGVRVTPGSGDFGSVFLGESKSMIFTFANTGNVDVDIVGSDMPASGFTVSGLPGTLKAGEDVAVLVTFAPSELGSYPGMFRVFYNYGVEASEIALAGVGTDIPPSPGITVSPESGDFGSVNLGESKSMIFTFANTGNVDVDIQGTDIPASGFTVSGLPGTIKAGKSVPVLVTFTPAELRSYSGVFRAFYNYGVEPSEINLIGVGSHEPAAPGITVSPESGDFGSVNLGESKSMIFTFTNTGNVDIDIEGTDLPASGFTVSGLPGTLKAGEDVAVLVTFAPSELRAYSGVFRVFYNYGVEASEIALAGVGTDIPPSPGITVSPESGDFGSVNLGESKSMIFTFTNTGNVDIDIEGTDFPSSGFTVSGLPGTIKAGKSVPVLVTFTPAELRSYFGVFRAFYNYGVEPSEINLIGVGSQEPAAPGITVSPESGDFGSVNLSESKSMIFTFTNTGNVDIDIEGTDLPASGFTISGLPGTIKAGKSVSVLVTFTPDELRSYSGVFRVFYNYGVEPSEINLIGIGSHEPVAPGITVSPGSGDFGSVNLGESKSMIFTFANTGNADLNIIGTDIPTSGFTVNNLPAIIKTGEVATVFVTFTPSVSRSYSGVFRVFYDSGVGASEINLIGVGNKVVLVPGLSVNPRSNDYGSVILGESKSMLFTFSNTGNTDITIVDYDIPTSGFTVKGLSGTIKPDEDLVALVTFSPEQPRSYSGVLRVFYDSGLSASEISLSGIGVGNVIASIIPPGNINFGNAAVGDRLSANLVFTNKGNVDIQITAIDLPEDAGFTVAGIPALIPAYSTLNAVAIFTPDLPQFYTANLRVLYDHNLATSNIVLSGSGVYDVTDIIEVSEDDIIFGDCNTGESRSANLRFINKGSVPVTITAVDLPAGVFSVEGIPNTIPAYGVLDALVVFTPLFAKNYSAAMRVLYDHGVVTSDINLSGSGIDLSVPAVTVEPQAFSFGRVALGTTRTETLIITNTGNVDFNIIAVDPPDSRFVVSGLTSGSLAEGMSKVAVITFAPDALGDFSSNLRVLFDHDLPPQEITLQGTGIYLDVTPEVLDFPASEIGSSTVFNVTINNSSGLDLEVKSLDVIKTVAFSTEGLKVGDIIRSAGGKRVFQVTFKPTASGAFQDKLNFSVGPVTEAADTVTDVNLLGMYTVLLNGTANADFVVSEIDSFTADIDYKMEISASTNQPGQLFVLFSHDPLSTDKIYALTKNGTLQLFPYGALFGWQNLAYLDSASPGLKLDLSQVDLRPLGCSLCQGQNIDTGANDFKFGNIIITKPDNEVFSNASDFKFLNGTLYIATYINNSATGTSFNFNKGLLEMQSLNIHSLAGTWQVKSMYLGEFKLHPAKLVITEPGDGSISAKWNPQYKNLKIDYSEDSSYYFITFNIGAYNYKYWIKYLPADEFLGFYTCECNGEILEDFTPVCGLREGSSGEWLCKLFEEDDPADPVDTGDQVAQDVIVASFSGSNDMTTRPFKTDGPWELQWEATDRMYINLYEADGDYVASYSQDAAGNSSAYQPDAGEYYMEVKTYNANWKIDIVSIE